jgi:hypothetical protein
MFIVNEDRNTVTAVGSSSDGPALQRRLTVKFEDEGCKEGLLKLLKAAGADFMIRAEIPAQTVTCKLTGVSLEKALYSILEPLHLTFTDRDGVIYIEGPSRAANARGD